MRTGVAFTVSAADQQRLEGIVADRNAIQKHVWRARIILESARAHGTMESCAEPARQRPVSGAGSAAICSKA